MAVNILSVKTREEFRLWLLENSVNQKECWVILKRGKPVSDDSFWYIDAVEEALCFGWIDSTLGIVNGVRMQKFTPRAKTSNWTELNKERVRRLEKLGLMTDEGRDVLPDMSFYPNEKVVSDIKDAGIWDKFISFPKLYQRIRLSNLDFYLKRSDSEYEKALKHFISETEKGKMYGQWNDYGRLEQK